MSYFKQLLGQVKAPEQQTIAVQPRVAQLYMVRWMWVFFIGFIVLMSVLMGISEISMGTGVWEALRTLWPLLSQVLIYSCSFILSFVIEGWWKPIVALRVAAMQGDRSLLANKQPRPNAEALPLPLKFATRMSRTLILIPSSIFAIAFIILSMYGVNQLVFDDPLMLDDPSLFWGFAAFIFGILALVWGILILVFIIIWRQRHWIEIRQDGIQSWYKSLGMTTMKVELIPWHGVRLFACYRKPKPLGNQDVMIYEVASANRVVHWVSLQSRVGERTTEVPTLSFEEHQVQMRALCELVTARTGLPLYDLSKG